MSVLGGCSASLGQVAVPQIEATSTTAILAPTVDALDTPPAPTASAALPVADWAAIAAELRSAIVMVRATFPETVLFYEGKGSGTGIIVGAGGKAVYIITNAHVVQGAAIVTVALPGDARERAANVIAVSACDDLAVLRVVDGAGLTVAPLARQAPQVGDPVVAMGYPLGDFLGTDLTLTTGIVSKVGATFDDLAYSDLIQTDTAINSGNSGGPLINAVGEVVGINTLGFDPAFADGLNFAIAVPAVQERIDDLLTGQHYQWLGLSLVIGHWGELLADAIESGSPAARMGVEAGDVILKIEGLSVSSPLDVCRILRSHSDGDALSIEVERTTTTEIQQLCGELVVGRPDDGMPLTVRSAELLELAEESWWPEAEPTEEVPVEAEPTEEVPVEAEPTEEA
ncbi:MAG: trypsin-like serine protease [Candidatus Competibacteraceae bacterium]|nr:trypsin-like serine protease [Candidatus Competibacteraceae bacterium]